MYLDFVKRVWQGLLQKLMRLLAINYFLNTQYEFTCSKLTIEILEEGVKIVQS